MVRPRSPPAQILPFTWMEKRSPFWTDKWEQRRRPHHSSQLAGRAGTEVGAHPHNCLSLWRALCGFPLAWCLCLSGSSQPHVHPPGPVPCYLSPTGPGRPASLCLDSGDVCTHSDEQPVVQQALLTAKPWHQSFQENKGQSLSCHCVLSAFIWNLVHTKLKGLDPATPKSIPENIIQKVIGGVQYHQQRLFLLTEQVTSGRCSKGPVSSC